MDFDTKKNEFFRILYEYHFIFEIEKCCGYTEWISVYKKNTLEQLYDNLNIQFANNNTNINKLFSIDENGNKIFIDNNNLLVVDFIRTHPLLFKPIYPIPNWIVYKLYLDDGTCHQHN